MLYSTKMGKTMAGIRFIDWVEEIANLKSIADQTSYFLEEACSIDAIDYKNVKVFYLK